MRSDQLPAAEVEGLVTEATGNALLRAAGLDPAAARRDAGADDYAGVDLPVRATLSAQAVTRQYDSYNVVARLPGRHPGAGTVALMGHWDHLGLCRPEGTADRICNGAVDNASGIAVMLAVAARLGAGPRLEHDVIAIATTAEEMGLLGADYYADHPSVPLADIRILLNLDTVAIAPRGAPMAIIGRGTPLDAPIIAVARGLGRTIDEDGDADSFVRRQDGWAMAKHGVPAVMAGGSFSDMVRLQDFIAGPYHEPEDELTDATVLGGAADDADLHVALVRHFANEGARSR
jgi:Zn-dependent M28 family amino/carboxypeptidase